MGIVSFMKRIDESHFFSQYPQYKNMEELKKADLLIMPIYRNELFLGAQQDFFSLTQNQDIICKFYTEKIEKIPFIRQFSAPPLEITLEYGLVLISTIRGLIALYVFLKERTQGHKFKIRHIIWIKDEYYELDEFEGTIDDYKKLHQEMESNLRNDINR